MALLITLDHSPYIDCTSFIQTANLRDVTNNVNSTRKYSWTKIGSNDQLQIRFTGSAVS
jgi:hypothetical protein